MKTPTILTENRQEVKVHGSYDFPCAAYGGCENVDEFPWHWHEELELSVVEKGQVEYYAGQYKYNLSAGDAILINSGVLHGLPLQKNINSRKKDIVFSGRFIYGSYNSVIWQKYMHPFLSSGIHAAIFKGDVPWQAEIVKSIRQAHDVLCRKDYGFELIVQKILLDIFFNIFVHCPMNTDESHKNGKNNERMKQMLRFIHEHFMENISVEQIAAHVNVCTRECLRCFHEFVHMSPMQYVIHYRIDCACRMLKSGEYTITEICDRCGFVNPSYFSKTFRRIMGCSPREYKKTQQI